MDVLTSVVAGAWTVTAIQLLFVTQSRAALVERMLKYGVKAEHLSLRYKIGYGVIMALALAVWLWAAVDGSMRRAQVDDLQQRSEAMVAESEACQQDLRNAGVAVAAIKAKIDHQSRADTIAITAEYHLDYTFDFDDEHEDMSFHTFCDEHVDDALWFSDRDAPAFRSERAKLMGYGGAPNKKGGFVMECRWSVIANRQDWCRNYSPK